MKEMTIQIPDGKRAEWVNGVLTLVDEPQVDNRPITERIKTFEDACKELGDNHPFVMQYLCIKGACKTTEGLEDIIAYLRLRIIVAALNEGWEPKFTTDECRYHPWFDFYTKEQYDRLSESTKRRCVLRSGGSTYSYYGLVYVSANNVSSYSYTYDGSRLVFRTSELAKYAGEQFIEEWADFEFKPRSVEGLNEKSEAGNTETIDFTDEDDE